MAKQWIQAALNSPIGSFAFSVAETIKQAAPSQVQVLTYHQIIDSEGFDAQAAFLSSKRNVIGMPDLLEAMDGKRTLPPRPVLITFDDAYCNFQEVAWPILKRYGLPASLFVPTAYPDNPSASFWWDELTYALETTRLRETITTSAGPISLSSKSHRQQALRDLKDYMKSLDHKEVAEATQQICTLLQVEPVKSRILSWDQLRELAQEGLSLGAHTQTHPLLTQIPLEDAMAEIENSFFDLEREIGAIPRIFAYPAGAYNQDVVNGLKGLGVRAAFTTDRGVNDPHTQNPLLIKRNNVGPTATSNILRGQLIRSLLN